MRAAGVPLVPGTEGVATPRTRSAIAAAELGFPVLLKATAGGGGKGMRVVDSPDGARGRLRRRERRGGGGVRRRLALPREGRSPRRATSRSRCSATAQGGVLTLGERECSIQRRHQKLVEESPSPALTPETREEMEAAVERACRAARVRERRHLRVPARARTASRLHRGQLPAPGRASGDGDDARGSTSCASSSGSRPGSRSRSTGRAPRSRARDRDPDQRRGSGARLRSRRRDRHALPAAARPRRAGRHGRR